MSLSDALQSSYRAFMGGRELKGAFLDGVERSWGQVEVARNLFTNPNLVGDGTYATVAENLFTNPNLMGDGTWPEVRRNLVRSPRGSASRAGNWGGGTSRTTELVGGPEHCSQWGKGVVDTPASVYTYWSAGTGVNATPVPGGPIEIGFSVFSSRAGSSLASIYFYDSSGSLIGSSDVSIFPSQDLPAGAWSTRTSWVESPPAGTAFVLIEARINAPLVVGDVIGWTACHVSSSPGGYLDGSTTPETAGVSQPETYRWRWLGTPNASESVMESNGTWAEVARNLFTNPNLVGDGTWAEVRRNLCINPAFEVNTLGWAGTRGDLVRSTSSPLYGTASAVLTTTETGGQPTALGSSVWSPMVPGSTFHATAEVDAEFDAYFVIQVRDMNNTTTVNSLGARLPGRSQIAHSVLVPEGAKDARVIIYHSVGIAAPPVGAVLKVDRVYVGTTSGPYLDGSTTPETAVGVDQPEDFRWRWIGTPNASESVMEGQQVAGFSFRESVGVVSSCEGKPAARIIPTTASTNSYIEIDPRYGVNELGNFTALGSVHTREAITGAMSGYQKRIRTLHPDQSSPVYPPNTPNTSTNIRYQFAWDLPTANSGRLLFFHGGSQGSGDVWWTDIGLFAGDYTGGVFSGGTTPETAVGVDQPEDFRWRWLGAENASESVMEIEQVRGLTPFGTSVVGVSTRDGKPAARLIPLGTSTATYAAFTIPAIARASGTVVGTLHLDAPITGPVNGVATRTIDAEVPRQGSDQPLNEAGSYPLRSSYSDLSSPFRVRLWHGGTQGSADVWWTDIGLFAGRYTGEAFSGNTTPETAGDIVQPEDFRWRWLGAENASESVMEIEQVRGLTGNYAIAGVSTWEGKPAVRVIPTEEGSQTNSFVSYTTPLGPVRSGGTALGTLHISDTLSLPRSTNSHSLYTQFTTSPGNFDRSTAPSMNPGSYPLRMPFTEYTSDFRQRLYNGGAQGSGDVWWTDIGLFAGEYDGEAFSGDTPDYVRDTYTWEGERNNSPSIYRRYQ